MTRNDIDHHKSTLAAITPEHVLGILKEEGSPRSTRGLAQLISRRLKEHGVVCWPTNVVPKLRRVLNRLSEGERPPVENVGRERRPAWEYVSPQEWDEREAEEGRLQELVERVQYEANQLLENHDFTDIEGNFEITVDDHDGEVKMDANTFLSIVGKINVD